MPGVWAIEAPRFADYALCDAGKERDHLALGRNEARWNFSSEYMNRLPPPQPAALQAIGLCTRSLVPSDPDENRLRSFELRTTVYDRSSTDNHTTSFCVRCYLPAGPRFAATPVPERNALMSVAGEIIGVHEESGVIAILLHELIFLSARGQKRSGANDPNATSSSGTGAMWTDGELELIAKSTNAYAKAHGAGESHHREWKDTSAGEIRLWLGLVVYMGVHGQRGCYERYWAQLSSIPFRGLYAEMFLLCCGKTRSLFVS